MDSPPTRKDSLSRVGRKDGVRRRRGLSPDQARDMVRVREARRAFREFQTQCFWYLRPDLVVTLEDVPEIARGLRLHGGHKGFRIAARLSR